MGAGNSKNENAKPESCIECDLMDSYVDAVCDAVSQKLFNPIQMKEMMKKPLNAATN